MIFTFVYLQSVKTFWRLLAEIQTGTLEQNYLSPIPAWVNIAVGRLLAAVVETAIVVAVLFAVTSLAVDLQLTWRPDALIPLGFAVAGGAGYSLMIAGLTLAWKRVELLQELVLVLIMFGSGSMLPLTNCPAGSPTSRTWCSSPTPSKPCAPRCSMTSRFRPGVPAAGCG